MRKLLPLEISVDEYSDKMRQELRPVPSRRCKDFLYTLTDDEWINPFFTEGGGDDNEEEESSNNECFSAKGYFSDLSSDENDDEFFLINTTLEEDLEMDYPIRKSNILASSSTVISPYNPPDDTMMGPPQYAPATERPSTSNPYSDPSYIGAKLGRIRRGYNN